MSQLSGNKGEQGGIVSSEVFERGDTLRDRRQRRPSHRNETGRRSGSAWRRLSPLIAIYCAGTWAVVVLVQALT
jgi:hypothetical protein